MTHEQLEAERRDIEKAIAAHHETYTALRALVERRLAAEKDRPLMSTWHFPLLGEATRFGLMLRGAAEMNRVARESSTSS